MTVNFDIQAVNIQTVLKGLFLPIVACFLTIWGFLTFLLMLSAVFINV